MQNKSNLTKLTESEVLDMIRNELSYRKDIQVFRNNVGIGAAYNFQTRSLRRPLQIIRYGLCNGSSDLIGWKSVEITPDMVGKKLAVFTAIEVKRPTNFKTSDEQKEFIQNVQAAGGIGFIAKSEKDLEQL